MRDKRTVLNRDTKLKIDDSRTVRIRGETGRGASCIVYDAVYADGIGMEHNARIKECYPCYLPVNRTADGRLTTTEAYEPEFETAKQKFIHAYQRNVEVRNTLGLTNSTVNSTDIVYRNQTVYIMMTLDEGTDYRTYEDGSLKELFEHVKSLAGLIKKYHQNGYLHLDIKPENILILPETKEHVLLFDFDSMVLVSELTEMDGFHLSFSDGFSAPEQVNGEVGKIGRQTDIYSVGALVFFKLFGKKPELKDCKLSGVFHFEKMKFAGKSYQPKLYRTLTTFFKKTLAAAAVSRWSDMQTVIDALEELITLSDIGSVYLVDSFQYNAACFVGRRQEIAKTGNILKEKQLAILSGIGGIGKTETARRYAFINRNQYDTVAFLVFESSIKKLVCDEVEINGIAKDENETEEDYFQRKISLMQKILTPADLLIVDNFDVESDADMESLLKCPCKFIITTREDFRDFNYPQIIIKGMDSGEELLELFYTYNDTAYMPSEQEAVRKIIKFVDYHTMTVELTAKYLRDTNILPADLYAKFLEKEGVANTEEIRIKQRKDGRLRAESVNNHLRILFDLSGFDDCEKEIIGSLSLLAGIRIQKARFEELCRVDNIKSRLEKLIKRGWVEWDGQKERISLHQVIQDLVYKDMSPDASRCPCIVEGMGRYLTGDTANYEESKIRRQVFDVFMNRLSGSSIPYARLCLQYGKEDKLREAERICLASKEKEASDLLRKICRMKIWKAAECGDMFETDIDDFGEYERSKYAEISGLMDKAEAYCREFSEEPDYFVREFVEMGIEVHEALSGGMLAYPQEASAELDEIYVKIKNLFESATERLSDTTYADEEKERLYKKMLAFYGGNCVELALYANEHSSDIGKALWYQEQIDRLSESNFCGRYVSNMDLADEYEKKGDYEKVIGCYEKALESGEDFYEVIMRCMADTFLKMENPAEAVKCLSKILEKNRAAADSYSCYVCLDLIKIFLAQGEYGKARDYAEELLRYNAKGDNSVKYALAANYRLFQIEKEPDKKEAYWQECLKYYEMQGNEELDEYLYEFADTYVQKEEVPYEEIPEFLKHIGGVGEERQEEEVKIIWYFMNKYGDLEDFRLWYIILLLRLAELSEECSSRDTPAALGYCARAQEFYDRYQLKDECIQSMIYEKTAGIMLWDDNCDYEKTDGMRKLCNYELMAQWEIQYRGGGAEKETDIWQKAAGKYRSVNEYGKESTCLERAVKAAAMVVEERHIGICLKKDFYWSAMTELVASYLRCGSLKEAVRALEALYEKTTAGFLNDKNGETKQENVMKVKKIADYLPETGKRNIAVKVYMAAVYLLVEKEPEMELVRKMDIPDTYLKQICDKTGDYLDKGICQEDVDILIDLKEEMARLKEGGEEPYLPVIRMITEKYQYKEIEFKAY